MSEFIRRKARTRKRSISIKCTACGYTQYDIAPDSQKATALEYKCPRCGEEGPVRDA